MALVNESAEARPLTNHGPLDKAARLEPRRVPVASNFDFSAFYDEHVDGVWRVLEHRGVATAVLEDAVQDVFVIAHRRLGEFRGESSLKTWVTGIALRVAKDHRQSRDRRGEHDPLEDEPQLEARERPDEQAMANQALRQVRALVEQLDQPQREVFLLVEFEGFTVPEVAELTGANANTLSTRLRAARARFNELVEEQPGGLP